MENLINSKSHFLNTTTITLEGNNLNTTNNREINASGTGQTLISTIKNNLSNYNLVIDGISLTNSNAYRIIDNNDNDNQNSWLLENNGKTYVLYRLGEDNKKSNNGTTLIIAPIDLDENNPNPENYTDNAIIIKDFPFTRALNKEHPFGINLVYNITDNLKINESLGSGYKTISLGNDKGFIIHKMDTKGNINYKTYDNSGYRINNGTIANVDSAIDYIPSPIIPLPSANFLVITGKIDKDSIKKYTYFDEELGGTKTSQAIPPYYTEIYAQEYDINYNQIGLKNTIVKGDFNELKQIAFLSPNEMLIAYNKFSYTNNDITKKQELGSFAQAFNYNISPNSTLTNTTDVMKVDKQPTNSTNSYITYNSTLNEYTLHKPLNGTVTNTTAITIKDHIDQKVIDKNGTLVSNVISSYGNSEIKNITRVSSLPIPRVNNIHELNRNTTLVETKNGINILEITERGVNTKVKNFHPNYDYIDFSNILNPNTSLTITQIDQNTVVQGTNTTITLLDFDNFNNSIKENNFIISGVQGNVTLIDGGVINNGIPIASIEQPVNFNQTINRLGLNFTQAIDAEFKNSTNYMFNIELRLYDKVTKKPVPGLLITEGYTQDEKYRSIYNPQTGSYKIVENDDSYDCSYNSTNVNSNTCSYDDIKTKVDKKTASELLKDIEVHMTPDFKFPQDFKGFEAKLYINNTDTLSRNTYSIEGNYNCVKLSLDSFKDIFTPECVEKNRTLIMDIIDIFNKAEDYPGYYKAIYKIEESFANENLVLNPVNNNTNDTNTTNSTSYNDTNHPKIKQLNSTHFVFSELESDKNYTFNLLATDVCGDTIRKPFILKISNTNILENGTINNCKATDISYNNTITEQPSNSNGIIIGATIGGAAFIVGSVLAYCYRNNIRAGIQNLWNNIGNQQRNQQQVGNSSSQVQINLSNRQNNNIEHQEHRIIAPNDDNVNITNVQRLQVHPRQNPSI